MVKVYDTGEVPFTALRGVDLDVYSGEFVGIIGKSGSGKTTLINIITGIDHPTSGEVIVGDTPVHQLGENALAKWRGRTVGVVFQFFQLLPTLTILENVLLPMDFCSMYAPRERVGRAMELLEQVELADQANKLPAALSGGQQQHRMHARGGGVRRRRRQAGRQGDPAQWRRVATGRWARSSWRPRPDR